MARMWASIQIRVQFRATYEISSEVGSVLCFHFLISILDLNFNSFNDWIYNYFNRKRTDEREEEVYLPEETQTTKGNFPHINFHFVKHFTENRWKVIICLMFS